MLPLLKKRPQAAAAATARTAKPVLPPRAVVQRALIETQDFEAGEPWWTNAHVVIARFRVPEDAACILTQTAPRTLNL